MGYGIWKISIIFINTILATVCIPFIFYQPELSSIFWSTSYTNILVWLIVGFQITNAIFSIFSIFSNRKIQIFGLVGNVVLSLSLIVMLAFLAVDFGGMKLPISLPLMIFIAIDGAVSLSINTIKLPVNQQLNIGLNQNVSNNNVPLKDSNELKTRIINMQTGLNKSFEDAVDEIEKTGELSGLKIGKLDDEVDTNRIVPLSLEVIEEKKQYNDKPKEYQEKMKLDNDVDYESIRETSLSRRNDIESDLLSKEEYDEWETH